MEKATIIGIDLAKRVFHLHGATADGRPVLRKKVSRAQLLSFLARQSRGRRGNGGMCNGVRLGPSHSGD